MENINKVLSELKEKFTKGQEGIAEQIHKEVEAEWTEERKAKYLKELEEIKLKPDDQEFVDMIQEKQRRERDYVSRLKNPKSFYKEKKFSKTRMASNLPHNKTLKRKFING